MNKDRYVFIFCTSLMILTTLTTTHAQWVQTPIPVNDYVGAIAVSGSNIFVGTDSAVYVSTDDGLNWLHPANSGMQSKEAVYSFALKDSFLFAGTASHGVFRSTDLGSTWQAVNTGLQSIYSIFGLTVGDSGIFAGTSGGGIFLSSNDGVNWQAVNSGLTNHSVRALTTASNGTSGKNIFAATAKGVFLSTNNGTSWRVMNSGLTDSSVWSLAVNPGPIIFAGTYGHGVFRSTNNGVSWQAVNNGLTNLLIQPLAATPSGAYLFAGTYGKGVFYSTDSGVSWNITELANPYKVNALGISSSNIFAGVGYGDGVWRHLLSDILSVEQAQNNTPLRFALEQNYPNPFNPNTTIRYELAHTAHVTLKIYNTLGQVVKTLVDHNQDAGFKSVSFDANKLPSGLYFYRLQAGKFTNTKKMLLLK